MHKFGKYFVATLILAILVLPMVCSTQVALAGDAPGWYMNWDGVLGTESTLVDPDTSWPEGTGVLYPFEKKSLSLGFSKFGELIDGISNKGLSYDGRDAFCRVGLIEKEVWFNGWLIEIKYKTDIYSPHDRFIWAFALFADGATWGGNWVTVTGSNGGGPPVENAVVGLGGRQTNTYCETDDIRILSNGPRRAVAVLVTHIYDAEVSGGVVTSKWLVVDLIFTLIFNKVKKEVIILKDVCYRLKIGKEYPPIDVKLSNREQVDLGPDVDPAKSYAHFWHQKFSTCYGGNWLDTKWILREYHEEKTVATGGYSIGEEMKLQCPTESGFPAIKNSEKIWIDDILQFPGVTYDFVSGTVSPKAGFTWDEYWEYKAFVAVKWKKSIPAGKVIKLQYKNIVKELKVPEKMLSPFGDQVIHLETPESHHYDLAQFIGMDKKYVVFKAFWPTLSSYTLHGWSQKFLTIHEPPLTGPAPVWCDEIDMPVEPGIPFSIGQWDFMLSNDAQEKQFRAVEVLGMVNYHDADDAGATNLNGDGDSNENQVDTEVYYQLQEVFNPWDLNDATGGDLNGLGKKFRRVVEYFTSSGTKNLQWVIDYEHTWRDEDDKTFDGGAGTNGSDIGTEPDVDPADKYGAYEHWYRYCTFAEKVVIDGVLAIPDTDYRVNYDANTINFIKSGSRYKVIYSTPKGDVPFSDTSVTTDWQANWEWIIVGRDSAAVDSAGSAVVSEFFKNKQMPVLWSGLDMKDVTNGPTTPFVMVKFGSGNDKADYKWPVDGRSALKDDWCTSQPVKTSDMISVGGPNANMLTYYFNDFTNAYWETNKIRALTCWSKNKYVSVKGTTGYAVISTYKDIDGTIGFLVWGVNGEDTYWGCWWLWHFGWKLQKEPDCVTDIILKFDYSKLTPSTFSHDSAKYKPGFCFWEVVEALGTISEFDFQFLEQETKLVFEFTGTGTKFSFIDPTYATLLPTKGGARYIKLHGCWLPIAGHLVASTDGSRPNIIQGDWSSSPFWMVVKDSETVYEGTTKLTRTTHYTIDYTAGTITFIASRTNPKIKFQVKQPPHHKCNPWLLTEPYAP